jgi:predicted metal-dependent hydrolase
MPISSDMEVKIIRSRRRRRTVGARLVNNTLLISAPELLSEERLEKIVTDFKSKFERKKLKDELDRKYRLPEIAAKLNERYFDNGLKINSIEYVTVQNSKLACCNYRTGHIRISHRIGFMPDWVRDYVIIHEMAHLIEPNHSRAFWDIVCRYKLAERARGYLMAAGRRD